MSVCTICLNDTDADVACHARCAQELFGAPTVPAIDLELAKIHTAGLAMVGRASLSGVQKKISVSLSADRATLQVALDGGRYILKPQTGVYPALPENEHVTTRLAGLVGLETARGGLMHLADGSPAFVAARFDRLPTGRKVRQEDFNQLAEQSTGSAELCVRLLRRYASEPLVEILKLYRQLVFAWWTGNGDMHMKNFSLYADDAGRQRLTPAYDQVCTRLVIPNDPLALPVQGKKDNLTRDLWLRFADYCQLPRRAAERVLRDHAQAIDPALALVARSFLPAEMKAEYQALLRERGSKLAEQLTS
jgi:serine/threonine-protein kinase HipA